MLFIHVGLHKTGSTAIQDALAQMTPRELAGFTYLGSHSPANNDGYLPSLKGPQEVGFVAPTTHHSTTTRTERILNEGGNAILSSEAFLGSKRGIYPQARDRARQMYEHFGSKVDFKVIIYLRPQTTWLESVYIQMIQEGESVDAEEFTRNALMQDNISFANLITDLKDVLGPRRVIVRPYSAGIDVIADFLTVISLPVPHRLRRSSRANRSITPSQAALMRLLNKTYTREESADVRHFLQVLSQSSVGPMTNSPHSLIPTALQKEIKSLALRDFSNLKDKTEDPTLPSTNLFDEVIDEIQAHPVKPQIESQWTNSVVAAQAAECIRDAACLLRPDRGGVIHLVEAFERKLRTNPQEIPNAVYRRIVRDIPQRMRRRDKT